MKVYDQYQSIQQLTSTTALPRDQQTERLNDFAIGLGWRPSDSLHAPQVESIAQAHLVVEHGLENTAVITFLKSPRQYSDLQFDDTVQL